MKGRITDKIRIFRIIETLGQIEQYLTNVSYSHFLTSPEKRFATTK